MHHKLALAAAAAVAIVGFTAPAAQAATPSTVVYPPTVITHSAVGQTTTCHGVTLVAVYGQLTDTYTLTVSSPASQVRGLNSVTEPTVQYAWQSDPTRTVTMTGHSEKVSMYSRYRWYGTYTYDWTFTNPDGTVFGTQVGRQSLTAWGAPMGAVMGSCSTPL